MYKITEAEQLSLKNIHNNFYILCQSVYNSEQFLLFAFFMRISHTHSDQPIAQSKKDEHCTIRFAGVFYWKITCYIIFAIMLIILSYNRLFIECLHLYIAKIADGFSIFFYLLQFKKQFLFVEKNIHYYTIQYFDLENQFAHRH